MVDDLMAGHVQNELVAPFGVRTCGNADCPIGVVGVQLAALADHLGLDPDPKAKAQRLDLAADSFEAAGELGPIGGPVTKGAVVVVASTEPAVIENEHLNPQALRRGRDLEQTDRKSTRLN